MLRCPAACISIAAAGASLGTAEISLASALRQASYRTQRSAGPKPNLCPSRPQGPWMLTLTGSTLSSCASHIKHTMKAFADGTRSTCPFTSILCIRTHGCSAEVSTMPAKGASLGTRKISPGSRVGAQNFSDFWTSGFSQCWQSRAIVTSVKEKHRLWKLRSPASWSEWRRPATSGGFASLTP